MLTGIVLFVALATSVRAACNVAQNLCVPSPLGSITSQYCKGNGEVENTNVYLPAKDPCWGILDKDFFLCPQYASKATCQLEGYYAPDGSCAIQKNSTFTYPNRVFLGKNGWPKRDGYKFCDWSGKCENKLKELNCAFYHPSMGRFTSSVAGTYNIRVCSDYWDDVWDACKDSDFYNQIPKDDTCNKVSDIFDDTIDGQEIFIKAAMLGTLRFWAQTEDGTAASSSDFILNKYTDFFSSKDVEALWKSYGNTTYDGFDYFMQLYISGISVILDTYGKNFNRDMNCYRGDGPF